MGPAHLSHPAEFKVIMNDLKLNNVSVKYDGNLAFSPNTAGGKLGDQLHLPNVMNVMSFLSNECNECNEFSI